MTQARTLDEGLYEGVEFHDDTVVQSSVFANFKLTANQILKAKL
jgi:hypothetical protein